MDSYLSNKSDQQETVEVEDLKKDLSTDFSMLQQSSIEEQEHLKVYLRVRPFTSAESSNGESQECVNIEPPDTVLLKLPSVSVPARGSREKSLPQTGQRFQFSQVYGPETTQTKLFEGTVKKLVKDVLEGGNSLVFTYGVTNAGKTFTFLGPDADAGILPRSLHMIFSSIGQRVFSGASVKPHRCREFARLSRAQQADDALFKRNLFRQHKENDKSNASLLNCTYKDVLEGSEAETIEDRISLHVDTNTTFSVWVSFCEIYNENIHDLLEATPNGALRRTALRLSQDIKGNAYVKDLRWVQVNSAQEAYTVMKLGKKNQSFSSTRLNQLSSRSHSIFSIRILRIEDIAGTPRVHTVSELCLCDLAGSERCAKTQNKGDRLKEAGNINTSLLILGKCINALRHNQQAKFLQHVPFRESKLTHYLQSFFCGRGAACMIVNINQCASMYDETLNVLKFSAVAQKVVVLSSRALPITSQRSSSEVSFTINNAGKKAPHSRRSSSLIGWDSSLEDVQEDEDDDDCDEGSVIDDTMDEGSDEDDNIEADKVVICKETHQRQGALLRQLQVELKKQEAQGLLIEARVREEVSQEFSELFSEMRTDFDERLAREREILEERSERRLEIFKNLVDQISSSVPRQDTHAMECFLESFSSELTGAERLSEAAFPGRRPGAGKDVESGNLLTQLQEKSSQCAQLEESVESLKKRLELNMQPQEALAASEPEKPFQLDNRAREELEAEVEQLRRRKEELQSTLAEEREMRERAEAALQAERRREAADELAEEKPHREDEVQSALTKEKEELRERWDTAQQQLVMAAERADNIMVELRSAQEQMEQRSKEIQEKSSHILNLQQERDGLKQELHAAKITSACSSDELREESDELRRKLSLERERHDSAERRAQQLEGEVADLKQQLLEATQRLRPRVDIQQAEVAKAVEPLGLSMENAELLDEVASLRTKVSALEETQELKEKEAEEKLQDQAAHITSLQKAQQERREDEEVERNAAQEARRAETERRRELLAVAHEAIAQKEAELQRRVEEISSLKESVRQESEKAEKFNRDLQRREDDSSELREKLSDYKKQMEQVQKEISVMREEEKSLGQKLADAEKTKKQLLSELAVRDRTIQQIKAEQTGNHQELHQKACRELEAKERVMEEMRLALTEQEDTQQQMETMLDEKLTLIHQLHHEVEKLKAELQQSNGGVITASLAEAPSDDITVLKQEAAQAEENLKTQMEKHQAERRKWLEEKLSLIGQAKEAEHRRNQEMRKFAEDRERYVRQQRELESQLTERDQSLDEWRKERDTLVAALEVQLQKLLSSQAEKEAQLQQLRCSNNHPPPEVGSTAAELQVVLTEKEAQISQLKMELEASRSKMEETKAESSESASRTSGGKDTRVSVSSQSSAGGSVVLDSFEISTESGRRSRFPKPELEIAFSSLQPNRMALRRQGEESAVTVKITRSARKRKSGEMEKSHIFRRSKRKTKPQEDVEVENRKNTTTRLTHQDESFSPTTRLNARRKEGTLQKIGDFLQSSPTLLGSKAKKMMSLVSGRSDADASSSGSSSSLSRRANKTKRKLYRPEISSPMEMSPHTIISREPEEKESDHQIIKRRLRSRIVK